MPRKEGAEGSPSCRLPIPGRGADKPFPPPGRTSPAAAPSPASSSPRQRGRRRACACSPRSKPASGGCPQCPCSGQSRPGTSAGAAQGEVHLAFRDGTHFLPPTAPFLKGQAGLARGARAIPSPCPPTASFPRLCVANKNVEGKEIRYVPRIWHPIRANPPALNFPRISPFTRSSRQGWLRGVDNRQTGTCCPFSYRFDAQSSAFPSFIGLTAQPDLSPRVAVISLPIGCR